MLRKVLINSKNREIGGTISNGRIKLDDWHTGEFRLVKFSVNNSFYNVNAFNNKIYFNESSTLKTASIVQGFYSPSSLAVACKIALDLAGINTYTTIYNDDTGKLTISATGNFGFQFASNTDNTSRYVLGFNKIDDTESTSIVAPNVVNLSEPQEIFCRIEEDTNREIHSKDYFTSSFAISDDKVFRDVFRYTHTCCGYNHTIKFGKKTRTISWFFFDVNRNELEFNGSEFIMIFEKIKK